MTHKRDCEPLFQEGYTNRNFDFVMDCVSENYIDRSPAGARSNADAVGILKIVAEQYPICIRKWLISLQRTASGIEIYAAKLNHL